MALIIDGVTIPEEDGKVIVDGVNVQEVIVDGTTVWEVGTTTSLQGGTATASGSPTCNPNYAGVRFLSTGEVDRYFIGAGCTFSTGNIGDWITGTVDGSLYEIRLTIDTGDTPDGSSDAVNTWLPLSSSREWELNNSSAATVVEGTYTVEIREIANTSNSVTWDMSLNAEIT